MCFKKFYIYVARAQQMPQSAWQQITLDHCSPCEPICIPVILTKVVICEIILKSSHTCNTPLSQQAAKQLSFACNCENCEIDTLSDSTRTYMYQHNSTITSTLTSLTLSGPLYVATTVFCRVSYVQYVHINIIYMHVVHYNNR